MDEPDVKEEISLRKKIDALVEVARYRPFYTSAIVLGGIFVALLEGVGLSFILPIIELVRESSAQEADGLLGVFVTIYDFLGVPFTLEFVILGVSIIMFVRYTLSFIMDWLQEALRTYYVRYLQTQAFDGALDANVAYFDNEGSDDILNAIVTQTFYAGRVIRRVVRFLETLFISFTYFFIALVIAPFLTLFTALVLGGFTYLIRYVIEPGYDMGERVADANEGIQQSVQAGTQGIRDVKMFGMQKDVFDDFLDSVNQFARSTVVLRRNEKAINNFYNLFVAVTVFVLIYLALRFANLSFGALGVFLFAMFRLAPRVSNLNQEVYRIENDLPHLVRTQEFIDELQRVKEPESGTVEVPETVDELEFDDVWFSYGDGEDVLVGVSFDVGKNEFVGFVGQSGAGKSTIMSLICRMYEPDEGEIRANGKSIGGMDIDGWRSKVSVVRQNSFIFNDTLRYNLTMGDEVGDDELDRVCRISQVTEFFEGLPYGYDTVLGDNGVKLSGGQRQRVALARALLKDADILILDEATSDLDSNTEKQVHTAIERMEREYAVIAIAHRLSTVRNADRIYTVEDGEIIETGDHDELISLGGKYSQLYEIQSES